MNVMIVSTKLIYYLKDYKCKSKSINQSRYNLRIECDAVINKTNTYTHPCTHIHTHITYIHTNIHTYSYIY